MTQKAADEVVKQTCDRINEDNLPLFVIDGRSHYKQALLDRYSYFVDFPKTGNRGRPRKSKQVPLKKLKYAQIVKEQNGGKLSSVIKKKVFGDFEGVDSSMVFYFFN
jgi:hypothetical protein